METKDIIIIGGGAAGLMASCAAAHVLKKRGSVLVLEGNAKLGRKLLAHSLRNMRSLKIKTAYLWVNENDADSLNFFRDFGFEPDGKRRSSQNGKPGEEIRCKIDIY